MGLLVINTQVEGHASCSLTLEPPESKVDKLGLNLAWEA